jgi:hypothetical protein
MSVVVTPEQHQLLSRLAELQGRSQASYVRRLIDLAEPSLRRVLSPLEQLEAEELRFDDDYGRQLADDLDEADRDMADQLNLLDPLEVQDDLDRSGADRTAPSVAREDRTAPIAFRKARELRS